MLLIKSLLTRKSKTLPLGPLNSLLHKIQTMDLLRWGKSRGIKPLKSNSFPNVVNRLTPKLYEIQNPSPLPVALFFKRRKFPDFKSLRPNLQRRRKTKCTDRFHSTYALKYSKVLDVASSNLPYCRSQDASRPFYPSSSMPILLEIGSVFHPMISFFAFTIQNQSSWTAFPLPG